MVVSSSTADQQKISQVLENLNLTKLYFFNEGQAPLLQIKGGVSFDACILDWDLAGNITSVQFCKELRKQDNSIPIIAMLPEGVWTASVIAYESGATYTITKDYRSSVLAQELDMVLNSCQKVNSFRRDYPLSKKEKRKFIQLDHHRFAPVASVDAIL